MNDDDRHDDDRAADEGRAAAAPGGRADACRAFLGDFVAALAARAEAAPAWSAVLEHPRRCPRCRDAVAALVRERLSDDAAHVVGAPRGARETARAARGRRRAAPRD